MTDSTLDPRTSDREAPDDELLAQVAEEVVLAERILVVTGAGLSADSGLPTYRGVGGLYDRGVTDDGFEIEDALSGQMLQQRPDLCWKYIYELERTCRGATPNAGHRAIKELENHASEVWVLTQNVDGFHRDVGTRNLIEVHGNLRKLMCTACDYRETVKDYEALDIPPACPKCKSLVRPEVVLFGEALPVNEIRALSRELERGFDLVFSVGTSAMFAYIAQPVLMARAQGRPTVEIDPGETPLSSQVRYRLQSRGAPTLERLVELLR